MEQYWYTSFYISDESLTYATEQRSYICQSNHKLKVLIFRIWYYSSDAASRYNGVTWEFTARLWYHSQTTASQAGLPTSILYGNKSY